MSIPVPDTDAPLAPDPLAPDPVAPALELDPVAASVASGGGGGGTHLFCVGSYDVPS